MRARVSRRLVAWLAVALALLTMAGACPAQSVLAYHNDVARTGNFIAPSMTWERARSLHIDPGFQPRFAGHLYAQPLYWQPPGSSAAMLVVATEDDGVHAFDARSGSEIWTRSLGRPVPLSTQPCGNIDPLGITGTPVIDAATQTLYVAAIVPAIAEMPAIGHIEAAGEDGERAALALNARVETPAPRGERFGDIDGPARLH